MSGDLNANLTIENICGTLANDAAARGFIHGSTLHDFRFEMMPQNNLYITALVPLVQFITQVVHEARTARSATDLAEFIEQVAPEAIASTTEKVRAVPGMAPMVHLSHRLVLHGKLIRCVEEIGELMSAPPAKVSEEFADLLIRLGTMFGSLDEDNQRLIIEALFAKMEANRERPARHGSQVVI